MHEIDTVCPACLREHAPACNADWDVPCERCGLSIGSPAEGVPPTVCWRCHMGLTQRSLKLKDEDAYDRSLREAFAERDY